MEENRTVRTIENEDWFLRYRKEKKHNVVGSQNIGSAQVYLKDLDYYQQVSNTMKGGKGEVGAEGSFYDVLSSPPDVKHLKASSASIIIQKVYNDLSAFNALFKKMKEDGVLEEEIEITTEDIGKAIINNVELVTWV